MFTNMKFVNESFTQKGGWESTANLFLHAFVLKLA